MEIQPLAPARTRRTNIIIGALVAAVVLVAGIGYAVVSNNPAVKLARALSNTISTSTMSLSARVTPAYLQETGLSDESVAARGMGRVTSLEDLATAIEDATIEFASQTSPTDTTVENAQFTIKYRSAVLLRLALIERIAYLQTHVARIADWPDAPITKAHVDQLFSLLESAPKNLSTAFSALKSGRALSVNMAKSSPLGDVYDSAFVNSTSPANQNRQNELGTAVLDALSVAVTVTRAGADSDGDIYNITLDAHSFLKRIAPTLETAFGANALAGLRVDRMLQQLKPAHRVLRLRAWLRDDVVNKIALDLTSLLPSRAGLPKWSSSATVIFLPLSLDPPADALDVTAVAESLLSD